MAWASAKRVAIDEDGLVHLFRVGSPDKLICGRWFYKHVAFEQPTCISCIAYWTHPCSDVCAMFGSCENCDGNGVPP